MTYAVMTVGQAKISMIGTEEQGSKQVLVIQRCSKRAGVWIVAFGIVKLTCSMVSGNP